MVLGTLRRVAIPLTLIGLLMAAVPAIVGQAAYAAPAHAFAIPAGQNHDLYTWHGVTLQSPDSSSAVASTSSPSSCSPDTKGDCEDISLTVPAGVSPSTLYLKVRWIHPVWKAYLYAVSPNGTTYPATADSKTTCDRPFYDKGCGAETTQAFDEMTIPNPAAGVWKVRVAAVNIHDEAYEGLASLVKSTPLQYAKEQLAKLMSHLTKNEPVNIVFAGWKPTATELQQLKDSLTDEYIPEVAGKASTDGNDRRDTPASGLVQHQTNHYTGTDPNNSYIVPGSGTGNVPYFEPIKFRPQYHFFAADDTYTKDLFAAAKAATAAPAEFSPDSVYATNVHGVPSHEKEYLAKYNAQYGQYRGAKAAACTAADCKVDVIDAFKLEDWIENSRLDLKYARSFKDLQSGAVTGAQFINPDPTAVRDPFWTSGGTRPANLDKNPQGVGSGLTFLLMDTFFPTYADQYFSPNRYHTYGTFNHIVDPDTGADGQVDNARGWGGRFRFYFQDLGAAPSFYERENWLRGEVSINDGSAAFDPPIWQYRNDPTWASGAPSAPGDTDPALRAGGSVFAGVMGWDIDQHFAFKYLGSYLYRPIPSDYYIIATTNWIDHYSQPSEGGFYSINFDKAYQPKLGLQALNSASPYASFGDSLPDLPNLSKPVVLGCADNRHQVTTQEVGFPVQMPGLDPRCSAATNDPRQHAIEQGKNDGDTLGEPPVAQDTAVNVHDLRNYLDHNRAKYAPLRDGAFTVPVLNIYFEKFYNVAAPLIVGGIAENSNNGEGWGQIDNLNERSITKAAIDCAKSLAVAPACLPGGGPFSNARGLTYIVQHEAAHFQGLHHPHDGTASVEKSQATEPPQGSPFSGKWHYYYEMNKWQDDMTASPTTYGHTYGTYEVVDQERLMYGHASEYLKQAQDWIADGYFMEAAAGATSPSAGLRLREATMKADRDLATKLFRDGDYLHSQYAMRNAVQHAKGAFFPAVAPHRMSLTQAGLAATDPNVKPLADAQAIFAINPQPVYDPYKVGAAPTKVTAVPPAPVENLPNTAAEALSPVPPAGTAELVAVPMLGVLVAMVVSGRRRVRRR